jgi:uncharacterized membrane protein
VIILDALALAFLMIVLAVIIGWLLLQLADELDWEDQEIQAQRRVEAAEREIGQIAEDTQAAIYRLAQLRALAERDQEES